VFVVKNITKNEISIPDLRINLSPGDQVDLDMVTSRFYIEQSWTLKGLLRNHGLKCIVKDDGSGVYQIKTAENPSYNPNEKTSSDVIAAVKNLEEKLSKRLDEKIASQSQQPQIDINLLNQALSALQGIASQSIKGNVEKTDVDNSLVVDIQKRTLDRLSNSSTSNVKHEEQITDNNVSKNIEELEGLL